MPCLCAPLSAVLRRFSAFKQKTPFAPLSLLCDAISALTRPLLYVSGKKHPAHKQKTSIYGISNLWKLWITSFFLRKKGVELQKKRGATSEKKGWNFRKKGVGKDFEPVAVQGFRNA
jgi:hypothetical protein